MKKMPLNGNDNALFWARTRYQQLHHAALQTALAGMNDIARHNVTAQRNLRQLVGKGPQKRAG